RRSVGPFQEGQHVGHAEKKPRFTPPRGLVLDVAVRILFGVAIQLLPCRLCRQTETGSQVSCGQEFRPRLRGRQLTPFALPLSRRGHGLGNRHQAPLLPRPPERQFHQEMVPGVPEFVPNVWPALVRLDYKEVPIDKLGPHTLVWSSTEISEAEKF